MPPVNGKVMQRVSCGTTIDGVYVPKGVGHKLRMVSFWTKHQLYLGCGLR
jgi:hypothetical protein